MCGYPWNFYEFLFYFVKGKLVHRQCIWMSILFNYQYFISGSSGVAIDGDYWQWHYWILVLHGGLKVIIQWDSDT